MKDREMIEKMAKSCKNCICNAVCDKKLELKYYFDNHDCEHYQPKLPEDNIVLSKEEYGSKLQDAYDNGVEWGTELGSKETAEKIAKYLFSICILEDIPHCMEKYFKKQFGVEIKE